MKRKLKELDLDIFFTYKRQIKSKMWNGKNSCTCHPISINLKKNSILHSSLFNEQFENLDENEQVILLNIKDWKLSLFQVNSRLILFDARKFKFYDFTMNNSTSYEIKKVIIDSKLGIYKGQIWLTFKEGKLDINSIKFKANKSLQTEIEKTNFLLFKELNNENNFVKNQENIFNYMFANNSLFSYINKVKKTLNSKISLDFNLIQVLNILIFTLIQSDFYNALIIIRSIRNLIISFIYESIFIPKYREMESLNWKLESKRKIIKIMENPNSNISKNGLEKWKKEEQEIQWQMKKIKKWNNNYDTREKSSISKIIKEYKYYYKNPNEISTKKFNSVKLKLNPKHPRISEGKILNFIENEILINKKEKNEWATANLWTNSSVHKNNYDKEGFSHWYLELDELKTLKKILSIYLNILDRFKNNLKIYQEKIL